MGLTAQQWEALPATERDWWLERHHRRLVTHDCGHPREVCADPEREWFPQLEVCYPTMEREAAVAKYARRHEKLAYHDGTFPEDMREWSEHPTAEKPYHFNHGVTIWAAGEDLGLGGDFLGSTLDRVDEVERDQGESQHDE